MYSGADFLTGSGQVDNISISWVDVAPSDSWVRQKYFHQGYVDNWYYKDYHYNDWQNVVKYFVVIEWLRQNMDRFLSNFKHLGDGNPWASSDLNSDLNKVIHDVLYTGKYDHLEFGQLLETLDFLLALEGKRNVLGEYFLELLRQLKSLYGLTDKKLGEVKGLRVMYHDWHSSSSAVNSKDCYFISYNSDSTSWYANKIT